jgi:hypothetical protein
MLATLFCHRSAVLKKRHDYTNKTFTVAAFNLRKKKFMWVFHWKLKNIMY